MNGIVYQINSTDPYRNIAIETFLFRHPSDSTVLLLWQNSDCVVFGRNQNTSIEANALKMAELNVLPVRRYTGGGAVFHDLGNLNYSFISSAENQDIECWKNILLQALDSLGIRAEYSGRNDILANRKKFGGTAWMEDDNRFLYHGTIMISADCRRMCEVLTPAVQKFEGKQIRSVAARVGNLNELIADLSPGIVRNALIEAFQNACDRVQIECEPDNAEIETLTDQLKSNRWIHGENDSCSFSIVRRINHETVEIRVHADRDIIQSVKVCTDGMDTGLKQEIELKLIGKHASAEEIDTVLEKVKHHDL